MLMTLEPCFCCWCCCCYVVIYLFSFLIEAFSQMVQKVFLFLNKGNRSHPKRLAAKHHTVVRVAQLIIVLCFFFFNLIKHRVNLWSREPVGTSCVCLVLKILIIPLLIHKTAICCGFPVTLPHKCTQ